MLRKVNARLHRSLNKSILNSLLPIKKNDKKPWFDVHPPKVQLEEENVTATIVQKGGNLKENTR